jgi:hypothetical protein
MTLTSGANRTTVIVREALELRVEPVTSLTPALSGGSGFLLLSDPWFEPTAPPRRRR